MRNTKQRSSLLDLIKQAKKPLSAEALLALLPSGSINKSTIYRNLDRFHIEGALAKSVIEGVSYYYPTDAHHHHYMICRRCLKMVPVGCTLDDMALGIAKKHGFTITHHDMTIYGYCKDCHPLDAQSERQEETD